MELARIVWWWMRIAVALLGVLLFYVGFVHSYIELVLGSLMSYRFVWLITTSVLMSGVVGVVFAFAAGGRIEPWVLIVAATHFIVMAIVALFHQLFDDSVLDGVRGGALQLALWSLIIAATTYQDQRFGEYGS